MAGKTKSKSKKRPLDMRSKMYLVLALCSVMLLVSIGVARWRSSAGWTSAKRMGKAPPRWTVHPW